MEFIKELHEARLTRNSSNVKQLTYTDCCERIYLTLLALELMSKFNSGREFVKSYAKKTVAYSNYKDFRMGATDLHNFIYYVTGDDRALSQLKDVDNAKDLRQRTSFPTMRVNGYLHSFNGTKPYSSVSQLFLDLESILDIKSPAYKDIRRVVVNLRGSNNIEIRTAVTKLLFGVRAKLRSSDIISDLEKFAALNDLESDYVTDTEPTVSTKDTVLKGSDLIYLAQIVGQSNLYLALRYIELSEQGKSVPANLVKAINPVVQMVVDIVRAGPSHVAMLKEIHNRAKKALK